MHELIEMQCIASNCKDKNWLNRIYIVYNIHFKVNMLLYEQIDFDMLNVINAMSWME